MREFTYTVYDYGRPIGKYTNREIEEKLGIPSYVPGVCVREERTYRGRFTFEREEVPLTQKEIIAQEWDDITRRFKNSGYDLSRIAIVWKEECIGETEE